VTAQAKPTLLVHLVANGVRGDSRVLKSAIASRDAGIPSVILGVVAGEVAKGFVLDGIPVVLAPTSQPEPELVEAVPTPIPGDARSGSSTRSAVKRMAAGSTTATKALKFGKRAARKVERGVKKAGVKLRQSGAELRDHTPLAHHQPAPGSVVFSSLGPAGLKSAQWAVSSEVVLPMISALAVGLEKLAPTAIHVHDTIPLPAAVDYARRHDGVGLLYDAHEWVGGLVADPKPRPAFVAMDHIEREFANSTDVVLTVSDEMAQLIQARLKLRELPKVVLNAPSAVKSETGLNVRDAVGLASGVALLVYSGWVDPERGLGITMQALTQLPDVHLAIVVGNRSSGLIAALRLARDLGVMDRVHVTSYVPVGDVTAFLATADAGLIPRSAGEHLDVSLPTKFREYLHAGLPLIVSDNKTMAREVRERSVGEVFEAGDVDGYVRAVKAVLADPDRYRAAITDEYLAAQSWESQIPVLLSAYRQMGVVTTGSAPAADDVVKVALKSWNGARIDFSEPKPAPTVAVADVPRDVSLRHLAIGPANFAGQAHAWAHAAERELGVTATSFGGRNGFAFDFDRRHLYDPTLYRADMDWILTAPSHLIVDAFRPVLFPLGGADIGDELALIQRVGPQVALLCHGSEVRDLQRHMDRLPESYFHGAPSDWTNAAARTVRRNHQIIDDFDGHLFVSTPDLLLDVPRATWIPIVVNAAKWVSPAPNLQTGRPPVVLHLASRKVPPIKGSDIIDPVLQGLHDAGRISYLTGAHVTHDKMPDLVRSADIVVDQIRMGSYGVAAVETMAAGRLLIGSVAEDVRALLPEAPPMVDAPGEKFAEVMEQILGDIESYQSIAAAGPAYARTWHDGTVSARAMIPFLSLPIRN